MIGFENPYYLLGTLAAALPILIFLLTRDTIRKVAFSTLRFFAGTSGMLIKRKRWQEALLLALRVGFCLLLAVAFARPLLRSRSDGPDAVMQAGRAVAVLVDVSASMATGDAFEQARQAIRKTLDGLSADAAVTLIAFDRTPRVELSWTRNLAEVPGKLLALQPGAGGTDIAAALRKADEALEHVVSADKQILLVSDMQRSGWEGFQGSWKLHRGVKLDIQPVTPEKTAAAAIVAADYPQGIVNDAVTHAVTVRVANFSPQPIKDLPVRLSLNDKVLENQQVNLAAGDNVAVRFHCKFDQVGDNLGVVKLGDGSGNAFGTLYFNTRVIPKIEVRILSGSALGKPKADMLFFLQTALAPSADAPFVVQTLPAVGASAADLASAAVVVLADVDSVSPAVNEALAAVLQRGGGLLFLPGSHIKPEAFARNFGELAPCNLRRVMLAGEMRRGDSKAVLTRINLDHPIFEVFDRPHFGDFSAVKFDRYWEVTDSQLSKVPARFDDGRPFLLEKGIAHGSSVLLASALEPGWNNLPHRAVFLPFLHQVTRYLAQRTERPTGYLVGDALAIPPANSLRDPAGKMHQGSSFPADQCGFYTLLDAGGGVVMSYAVNGDLAETNPATVDAAEVKAALEPAAGSDADSQTAIAGLAGPAGKEIWVYVVAALLLMMVLELSLANQVARH
jgi:hypothetical protein